jgi:type II secretory pathway component PulF
MITIIHTLLYKGNKKYKYICDKYIQKIYLIGKITHLSIVGRFIFIFNKLSNSGIPIVDSLTISKNAIDNLYLKDKLSQIVQSIEDGKSLAQSFKDSGEFEHMILQMIKSGESSGSLNLMLEKIDKYYNTKYNEIIDNISTYIEPIMIFFIAIFLLIMALGIFLPMWSIADIVS